MGFFEKERDSPFDVDAPSTVKLDKWKVDGDERERVMECQWRFDEMV